LLSLSLLYTTTSAAVGVCSPRLRWAVVTNIPRLEWAIIANMPHEKLIKKPTPKPGIVLWELPHLDKRSKTLWRQDVSL